MDRRHLLKTAIAMSAGVFSPWPASAYQALPLVGYLRTNWSIDPYALGSYSHIPKGASRRDHKALETPVVNRLYFAGEAVHAKRNSTVHAAYESGQRSADRVLTNPHRHVAVIGAGMSGLSAAHKLSNAGIHVTVFEARNRTGGRIWTDNSLDFPVDLGASWIHGTHGNPLTELADRLMLERLTTGDSYVIRDDNGKIMSDKDAPGWLDEITEVQHSAGTELDKLNHRAYWFSDDYEGPDVTFLNGYQPLLKSLEGNYKLLLNVPVTQVTYNKSHVAIHSHESQLGQFDAVIVTLPLGVLKSRSVKFSPSLPQRKQDAIDRLGMGVLDKLYLLFDDVFWDKNTSWILTPQNDLPKGEFNQWLNLYKYLNRPMLLAFNGGSNAIALSSLNDQDIVTKAINTLDLAYRR